LNFPVIFDRIIKPYILVLALIFTVAFLTGVFTPSSTREDLTKAFEGFAENYRGLEGGKLFFTIFLHNVVATIFMLISGIGIGIIPTLAIGANGFVLGVVYGQTAEIIGYSKAAMKVLPHGLFELPALLIAASYGLWLGLMIVRRMQRRERTPILRHRVSAPHYCGSN
jgi:stage II sporulation protein M